MNPVSLTEKWWALYEKAPDRAGLNLFVGGPYKSLALYPTRREALAAVCPGEVIVQVRVTIEPITKGAAR